MRTVVWKCRGGEAWWEVGHSTLWNYGILRRKKILYIKQWLFGAKQDFKNQFATCLCLTLYFRVALCKDYFVPFSQRPCPLDAVIFVLGSLNKVLAGHRLPLPLNVTSSIVIMLCDNVTVSSLSELWVLK